MSADNMTTESTDARIDALTAALNSILDIIGSTPLTHVCDMASDDLPKVAHQARREIAKLRQRIAELEARPTVVVAQHIDTINVD